MKPQQLDDGPASSRHQTGNIIPLRPPRQWHDPLGLIETQAPSQTGRIVLWAVCAMVLTLIVWAGFGQLDIIAGAEGKLTPQTLLKVVQPAESGVVAELLVAEGDSVKAGQVLARLDPTLAKAEHAGVTREMMSQSMHIRRLEAQLNDRAFVIESGNDPLLFAQMQSQMRAQRTALVEALEHERSLLIKAEQEEKSAKEILAKLEQSLPTYRKAAAAYGKLEKEGFLGGLAAAEKEREALEKSKDLDAQRATVGALRATVNAQQKRVSQLQSNSRVEIQRELAELRARVAQLQPNLNRTNYRQGLMELRAPQDGVIKDLTTTTVGAVVQPGSVVMTLIPKGEQMFADVAVKNEDVGFVRVGQTARIKLAAYPFQKYGMLTGKVVYVSADATEPSSADAPGISNRAAFYKARVRLDAQVLRSPHGVQLLLSPGMQVTAEISQGQRTVLEYLLSPVKKILAEAGTER